MVHWGESEKVADFTSSIPSKDTHLIRESLPEDFWLAFAPTELHYSYNALEIDEKYKHPYNMLSIYV